MQGEPFKAGLQGPHPIPDRRWYLNGQKATKGKGREGRGRAWGWWAGWEDRGQGQRREKNKGVQTSDGPC